jgi:hypothetical protein
MPATSTQTLQAQLDELGRSLASNVHALLVLDGAGWHHSTSLRVPANLTLRQLTDFDWIRLARARAFVRPDTS